MPIIEIPDPELLPKTVFDGAFFLMEETPDKGQLDMYYFYDKTWLAKADHILGWAREILVCAEDMRKGNSAGGFLGIGARSLLPAQYPKWLCGTGFRYVDSQDKYVLSGSVKRWVPKYYSMAEMEALAKDAIDKLVQPGWALDDFGFRSLDDWRLSIHRHVRPGMDPVIQWLKESQPHVRLHIWSKNHQNSIYHPQYHNEDLSVVRNAFGIGQTEANTVGNSRWQNSASTGPAQVFWALCTAIPSDSSIGTEASYTGYGRVAMNCNSTNVPAFAAGSTQVNFTITWPTNTGASQTMVDIMAMSAASGGTQPLYWGDCASTVIGNGNTPQCAVNTITISYT